MDNRQNQAINCEEWANAKHPENIEKY